MVGGIVPLAMVMKEITASTAPAAVSVWPIIDLFEEIGRLAMRSPKTAAQLIASILSFSGVEVPWALM